MAGLLIFLLVVEPVLRIHFVLGKVEVEKSGKVIPAKIGMSLMVGDKIRTYKESEAELKYGERIIKIGENKEVEITKELIDSLKRNVSESTIKKMIKILSKGRDEMLPDSARIVASGIRKKGKESGVKSSSKSPSVRSIAKLTFILGDVKVKRAGEEKWQPAKLNMGLKMGDEVMTSIESEAEITLPNGDVVKLLENTRLKLNVLIYDTSTGAQTVNFKNLLGKVISHVKKFKEGRDLFEIRSEIAVAGVRGTIFMTKVGADQKTVVGVVEGKVEVIAMKIPGRPSVILKPGEKTTVRKGEAPTPPVKMKASEINYIKRKLGLKIKKKEKKKEEREIEEGKIEGKIEEKKEEKVGKAPAKRPFSMDAQVGSALIEGELYQSIRLHPVIPFGKFKIALDIPLYFDKEGHIRKEDWDWKKLSTYTNKIYYVRYGEEREKIFFQIGALPSVSYGAGLIVNDYSNCEDYPDVKRTGLLFGGLQKGLFWKFTVGDLGNPSFFALRISYPLLLKNLRVGVTIAGDINQYSALSDADGDGFPDIVDAFPEDEKYYKDSDKDGIPDKIDIDRDNDNYFDNYYILESDTIGFPCDSFYCFVQDSDTVRLPRDPRIDTVRTPFRIPGRDWVLLTGVDVGFVLLKKPLLKLYSEIDKIWGKGMGIVPVGVLLRLPVITAKAELRWTQEKFQFGYFDRMYELNKVMIKEEVDTSGDTIVNFVTRESTLDDVPGIYGIFAGLSGKVGNILILSGEYFHDLKEGKYGDLYLSAKFTKKIKRINFAEAYLIQRQVKHPFELFKRSENTLKGIRIEYALSPNVCLTFEWRITYIDKDGDGKIELPDEEKRTFSVSAGFPIF